MASLIITRPVMSRYWLTICFSWINAGSIEEGWTWPSTYRHICITQMIAIDTIKLLISRNVPAISMSGGNVCCSGEGRQGQMRFLWFCNTRLSLSCHEFIKMSATITKKINTILESSYLHIHQFHENMDFLIFFFLATASVTILTFLHSVVVCRTALFFWTGISDVVPGISWSQVPPVREAVWWPETSVVSNHSLRLWHLSTFLWFFPLTMLLLWIATCKTTAFFFSTCLLVSVWYCHRIHNLCRCVPFWPRLQSTR